MFLFSFFPLLFFFSRAALVGLSGLVQSGLARISVDERSVQI